MYFFHFLHFLKITSQVKPDSKGNAYLILVQIAFMLLESRLNVDLIYLVFITFTIVAQTNANGGGERDRTDDLLLAKQALSQLSYAPSLMYCLSDRA